METKVASEKICYGVLSPELETVWWDCLSWQVHIPDYNWHRSTALRTPASTSARGHAEQDTGVPDTSPAFCLPTGPQQKNPGPDQEQRLKLSSPSGSPSIRNSTAFHVVCRYPDPQVSHLCRDKVVNDAEGPGKNKHTPRNIYIVLENHICFVMGYLE